jgi:hypothetical protein
MNRMTYLELKYDLMVGWDSYDPWGSAMSLFFDVAGEMYRRDMEIPDAWRYRPGLDADHADNTYQAAILAECAEDESLDRLGRVLHRLTESLDRQGRSY